MPRNPKRPTRPRTETAQAAARRQQILDAAAGLFSERGYAGVSVAEIAVAAGIGKATLYHYFKGREEILFAMHEIVADEILDSTRILRESGLGPHDALRGSMVDIIRFIKAKPGYLRVFFGHYRHLSKPLVKKVASKRDGYASYVEGLVREGSESREFREVDPRIAMLSIFGMCNWTYQWLERRPDLSAEEVGNAFADLIFAGLSAPGSGAPR